MDADPGTLAFREEASELLTEIEETLLELEGDPGNAENIARAFRSIHTIKGSGAMFGFAEIARFTHEVETALDKVRGGKLAMTKDLMSLILASKDHIGELLGSPVEGTEEDRAASDELIAKIKAVVAAGEGAPAPQPAEAPQTVPAPETQAVSAPPEQQPKGELETWWIRVRAKSSSFTENSHEFLAKELAGLGQLWELSYGSCAIGELGEKPEEGQFCWDFISVTDRGENAIRDVFLLTEDAKLAISRLCSGAVRQSDKETLIELARQHLGKRDADVGASLAGWIAARISERAPAQQKAEPKAEAKDKQDLQSGIRVDSSRLDSLVNLVGELVIIQSRLSQSARGRGDGVLTQIAEDLERLSANMRDQALGIRMQPIGAIFSSLRRLVRDLSGDLGKQVEFLAEGAKTELDKNVIDRIKDPLIHILRNCLDHGIEPPEKRLAAGKPEKGLIRLTAAHSGGEVVIKVTDDGGGIDLGRVRAKAVSRGLIAADAVLTDKEIMNLLFLPGFSTAEKISSVSGRGVGMDVVKKSIQGLRGAVDMESETGKGATLTIRLPLTLAIIDGLMVRVDTNFFVLPLVSVAACMERFLSGPVRAVESMDLRGKMIPCVSLRRLFNVTGDQPDYERVVIVGLDGQDVGLAVDAVVGQQQAVIKSLSRVYSGVEWISGTTIGGDGGVALILDVPKIVRFAEDSSKQ